ncbi:MAG: acetamidase/formamidase family protein [Candidatus Korarchaeum sp.]|nr:acetamidase/formamidase family protein [Candidatus Korarchaeum sp.]MDW8035960.1 acetamidase/formamidase family protein [Candidatus Korarchaeum sp.]
MKRVSKESVIYTFSSKHKPVETVNPGEYVLFETEDAFGGQVKGEETPPDKLDWSRVDGATGPVYVEGAELGDTLVVDVLDIKLQERGAIAVIPGYGGLSHLNFSPKAKVVKIDRSFVYFDDLRIAVRPMIGTIGVAPEEGEVPTGYPGRHGGNMDVSELGIGTRLYLPVFSKGALLALGDLHAVQTDGELCVSAIESPGEVLVRISLIKGKRANWPILETEESFQVVSAGKSLDEAMREAAEEAVKALMRARKITFEEAYMLGSLLVSLRINQVVDPLLGVRATIPKGLVSIDDFLTEH